eukprot:COSAG01_NODE_5359_length_4310_cov_55.597720_3_plen_390_part_00
MVGGCPSITRKTIYGEQTLECSGKGTCERDPEGKNTTHCVCKGGEYWARWQVNAANIRKPHGLVCESGLRAKASDSDAALHHCFNLLTFVSIAVFCWWAFGPRLPSAIARRLPPPRAIWRFTEEPWLLPKCFTGCALATLVGTVFGALFAGHHCNCFWIADMNHYDTISGLAEHPPMTVIAPLGVIISTFFATATVFALLKRARALPCYEKKWARAALYWWTFVALNAAYWGLGVNVFFNESWDHFWHIQLSYFYFTTAALNLFFLFPALLPELNSLGGAAGPVADCCCCFDTDARQRRKQLSLHSAWISVTAAICYNFVYKWSDKPHWTLGIYEHTMSAWQVIMWGMLLAKTLRGDQGTTEQQLRTVLIDMDGTDDNKLGVAEVNPPP